MKYSVLGFNQQKVVEDTYLDLIDLAILSYIKDLCGVSGMYHKLDNDGNPMVWIKHDKLLSDLPILKISVGRLRNKLSNLKSLGYINTLTVNDESFRGSRTYYGLTEIATNLIYSVDDNATTSQITTSQKCEVVSTTTSQKCESNECSHHINNTPDSILDKKDNILKEDSRIRESKITDFTHSYNTICTNLPSVKKLSDKRITAIKKLLKKYSDEEIHNVLVKASESDFLNGKNDRGWVADMDFILREDKFISIAEGKYDNHKGNRRRKFGENEGIESKHVTEEEIKNGYFTNITY